MLCRSSHRQNVTSDSPDPWVLADQKKKKSQIYWQVCKAEKQVTQKLLHMGASFLFHSFLFIQLPDLQEGEEATVKAFQP